MTYIVYLSKNIKTGAEYIGATKYDLAHRKKRHIYDAMRGTKGCRIFWAAIRKYGENSFVWSVLHEGLTQDDAMRVETEEILKRKPAYNITAGGRGLIGIPHTPEWNAKISAKNKGRKLSVETVAKMMASRPEDMNWRHVVCLEDAKLFLSVGAAAAHYNLASTNISSAINGRQNTGAGKHFILSDVIPSPQETKSLLLAYAQKERAASERVRLSRCRRVVCINTGEIFESATAAAKSLGLTSSSVTNICREGVRKTRSGLRLRFEDMPEIIPPERTAEQIAHHRHLQSINSLGRKHSVETIENMRIAAKIRGVSPVTRAAQKAAAIKPVVIVETGQIFPSVGHVADMFDLPAQTVYALLYKGNVSQKTGLSFRYAESYT